MQPVRDMEEQKVDYAAELERAREAVEGLQRDGDPATLEACWEVCCGDVLVAERNLENRIRIWENASLAREFLDIARYLEGYDQLLDPLHTAVSRMSDALSDHPRLKLELLELLLLLLRRIEALGDCDLDRSEEICSRIALYRRNIACADRGAFGEIEPEGLLKRDPVEWSSAYERIIDEVERKIGIRLADHPRGMGFCFAYWSAKAEILRGEYGLEWRSPAVLNPGVRFD